MSAFRSSRSLIGTLVVLALILLAVTGWGLRRSVRRLRTLDAVRQGGGTVWSHGHVQRFSGQFGRIWDDLSENMTTVCAPTVESREQLDTILAGLPYLPEIDLLALDRAPMLVDDDLRMLYAQHRLQHLRVQHSGVRGPGLERLPAVSLRSLDLTGTPLDDDGLRFVSRFTDLDSLWLDDTQITDAGLIHLRPLKRLRMLSLSQTNISEAAITDLRNHLPDLMSVSDD